VKIVVELTTQEWVDLSEILDDAKERLEGKSMNLGTYCLDTRERLAQLWTIDKVLRAMKRPR